MATDLRRGLFRVSKGSAKSIDPYLRSVKISANKAHAWFADQYCHPHESKHTIGEVLEWFENAGLEFVRGLPALDRAADQEGAGLFTPSRTGSAWDHFAVQAKQIVTGSREGGFFVMIARRPEE
jgi:hypothetical protein